MTNAEKFKEVFGLDVLVENDPCDIIDIPDCEKMSSCRDCLLNNFWEKEYEGE